MIDAGPTQRRSQRFRGRIEQHAGSLGIPDVPNFLKDNLSSGTHPIVRL